MARLLRLPPSRNVGSIEAIVPAFNEEPCIDAHAHDLLRNRYIRARHLRRTTARPIAPSRSSKYLAARTPRLIVVRPGKHRQRRRDHAASSMSPRRTYS